MNKDIGYWVGNCEYSGNGSRSMDEKRKFCEEVHEKARKRFWKKEDELSGRMMQKPLPKYFFMS